LIFINIVLNFMDYIHCVDICEFYTRSRLYKSKLYKFFKLKIFYTFGKWRIKNSYTFGKKF